MAAFPLPFLELGMKVLRKLQRADSELQAAGSRLERERAERAAAVTSLEAALRKLKEEHASAKVRKGPPGVSFPS